MFLTNLGKDMFTTTWKNLIIVLILTTFSCTGVATKSNNKENIMTEAIIGEQVWMAENLNVFTFRNGDTILLARTAAEWKLAGEKQEPACCYFDYDTTNSERCGKLYNWYAVNDPRGLAPIGWRVPTRYDWYDLFDYLDSTDYSTQDIMSTSGWYRFSVLVGKNKTGFNAFPYKHCYDTGDMVVQDSSSTLFWTITPFKWDYQHNKRLQYSFDMLDTNEIRTFTGDSISWVFSFYLNPYYLELIPMPKEFGLYVRCIKE